MHLEWSSKTSSFRTSCLQQGNGALPSHLTFERTRLEDHCAYKYLLNLAGNAASNRLKYLFFCNSTVVSPVRAGGSGGAGPNNEYEEFYFHRLEHGVNILRPASVDDLPALIQGFQASVTKDSEAERIAARGLAWAKRKASAVLLGAPHRTRGSLRAPRWGSRQH